MPDFSTRPAARSDLPAIRELVFDVGREFGFEPEPDGADTDLFALSGEYFVAGASLQVLEDANGKVCGMCGVVARGPRVAELRKLYVSRAARGQGAGARLLAEAVGFARAKGYSHVVLETSSRLEAAAKLYTQFGFRPSMASGTTRSVTCDRHLELDLADG